MDKKIKLHILINLLIQIFIFISKLLYAKETP